MSCSSHSLYNPLAGSSEDDSCIPRQQDGFTQFLVANFWPSAFNWQDTLLVSASTIFYTFAFLTTLYFWWANRQFHFRKRKKDGSRLSMLATREDALELRKKMMKQGNHRRRHTRLRRVGGGSGMETDDDDLSSTASEDSEARGDQGEEEGDNIQKNDSAEYEDELLLLEEEADLSDYDTDSDDDSDKDRGNRNPRERKSSNTHDENLKFLANFPPEKRGHVKDLTAVAANMEVFSYLSQEAFGQCLEFMEYVDLKQGQVLFEESSFDGSLFAVVSGQVKCQFEFRSNASTATPSNSNNPIDYDEEVGPPLTCFTAGDGDVVTSLLSMLAGLVRHCQERSEKQFPSADKGKHLCKTPIVPEGIAVTAVGLADNTRLVRVPPECFLAMLDKFPQDVHRISQTVVARMQRVTLQTVVRCLGLHKEVVQRYSKASNFSMDQIMHHQPEAWRRLKTALPSYLPGAAPPTVQDSVKADAAFVGAVMMMGRHQSLDSESMKNVTLTLEQEGSVQRLLPGQTLIGIGQMPDAIYIVLQGAVDVGMNDSGVAPLLKQSARRAIHKDRRSIFSHTGKASSPDPMGSTRMRRRSMKTASTCSTNSNQTGNFSRVYQAGVGEIVGTLSCFTGDASIVTARNTDGWEPAMLYRIPKDTFDKLVARYPSALTECLSSILDRLASPIVCLLDWNVEWMHVQAGEDVVLKDEPADAMYAVLNGRLRASKPSSTHTQNLKRTGESAESEQNSIDPSRSKGFLSRAKIRLKRNRFLRFIGHRRNRNDPKVAHQLPPPSRRMMNSTGEEERGEEFGRGAIIGEVEILTGADWATDVYASRHCELARLPVSVLNMIIALCPRAGLNLARVVASQIQQKDRKKSQEALNSMMNHALVPKTPTEEVASRTVSSNSSDASTADTIAASPRGNTGGRDILPSYGLPLATIAVVPLLEGHFDIDGFCSTLQETLHTSIAPTKLLTKAFARQQLGEDVFAQRNAMHRLKMTRLCGDMEENYRLVVYQAEAQYSWWTRLCIQQADCILLVVKAEEAPPQKKVEACLSWAFAALNVKIQLVVLQSPGTHSDEEEEDDYDETIYESMESSDQLNDWSEQRYWIAGHHLVRTPFRKHKLDFRRLCRRITGRSIGVVLGGGGARGLAHIGVIKALMEAGITVDFVGGTSQGAYIGALFACTPDDFSALEKAARLMADTMANNWERLFDLTLPLVSFFCGYRFNRGIRRSFGRRRIQDLVCNFFCVSTDIRNNVQVVHTKGLVWKYCRASMTLQSYLPPLSEDGALLVDGGYMNVLPADVMKHQMKARTVVAVDVSQEVILDNYEYGTYLNGWWLLWNSWNPFSKTVTIPSMGDISERLAWVSGERHKKKVRPDIDLFLQPPVGNYGVLEYDKFDEIVKLGYDYAKPRVDTFVKKYPHMVD